MVGFGGMSNIKLKPCPFCGDSNSPYLKEHPFYDNKEGKQYFCYQVICLKGDCGEGPERETKTKAVKAWNTRRGTGVL